MNYKKSKEITLYILTAKDLKILVNNLIKIHNKKRLLLIMAHKNQIVSHYSNKKDNLKTTCQESNLANYYLLIQMIEFILRKINTKKNSGLKAKTDYI